jgi:hypothetical protein
MKKFLIISAYFSISLMLGMENKNQKKNNFFSIVLYKTRINVSRKSLDNIQFCDLFITGKNDQFLLSATRNTERDYMPGSISYENRVFFKDINNENNSNAYEFFQEELRTQSPYYITFQSERPRVLLVSEPCISSQGWHANECGNPLTLIPQYKVDRFSEDTGLLMTNIFSGNRAISEAAKDLALCYQAALLNAANNQAESIVIPTLGADVGFPRDKAVPIALNTIIHFLETDPHRYKRIELVVRKQFEFAAYVKFLINYSQKPGLLILAHKDTEHFLYDIPGDIIGYILQLMHFCAG